jgi:hypothetical protein
MEDKRSIKKVLESQGYMHEKVANQSNLELSSSCPTQSPGPPHIQIDVQIAYDLCFGCSTYARKAKEITFPLALVPCPTKIEFIRNYQNNIFPEPFLVLHHYFGPMGHVSSWSPLGTCPRVRPQPNTLYIQ